jgi:putative sugar O-methyltransferase
MSLTRTIAERLNPVLRMMGAQLVGNKQLEHYQKVRDKYLPEIPEPGDLAEPPPEAREYLQIENPRLVELRQRYQQYKCAATSPSIWTQSHVSLIDLAHFRSDNPYVFQRFDSNGEVAHALTTYYLQRKDTLGLLERLREDRVFGAQTFDFESRFLVSRDLLDSINEINFLERTIGIASGTGFNVLDIGAGYGRFAHRLTEGVPGIGKVFCTDAIATSTFLCEYYLRFRRASSAVVVPLDQLEHSLRNERVDLAVNIHSFSECRMEAVRWWLDLVCRHRVRYLFIVPNAVSEGGRRLALHNKAGSGATDYEAEITNRGYRKIEASPKYETPNLQRSGVSPTWYHLFELVS